MLIQFIGVCKHLFMRNPLIVPLVNQVKLVWPSCICQTDGVTFNFIIICYTEEFMGDFMTARYRGPVAAKQT